MINSLSIYVRKLNQETKKPPGTTVSGLCNDRLTVFQIFSFEDYLSSTLVMKPRPSWLDGTVNDSKEV